MYGNQWRKRLYKDKQRTWIRSRLGDVRLVTQLFDISKKKNSEQTVS